MTDSDRERKNFRSSYDRRMNKEMLTSADFREKYKGCRLVFYIVELCTHGTLVHDTVLYMILVCITFMLFCAHRNHCGRWQHSIILLL